MMKTMKTIALGTQGLKVSKLGYGCMGLTTAYQPKLPDDEIITLLHQVYNEGITFWDTASIYAYPDISRIWRKCQSPLAVQDEIIGRAIAEIGREKIVLAHKTGHQISVFPPLKLTPNGDPSFIRQECEAALERMNADYIDVFYLHRIDQRIPIEVSMYEMKKLIEEGKIKYVGLSECSATTLRRAHKVHPISVVQMEYSLWCRHGLETDVLPTCKELGIGLVAYSPLGRGFFGGAHKQPLQASDFRNTLERFQSDQNAKLYDRVEEIATAKQCHPSQLALAWVEAQQDRAAGVVAIPGTTKVKNLKSNVESLGLKLTTVDLKTLEEAVPADQIEGGRYGGYNVSQTWEGDNNPPLTEELAQKWGIYMS